MTREEAIKFWKFRYENAKDYTDPHWEAQERREHREYVEALRMAIEALQADRPTGSWISRIDNDTWMLECSACGCRVQEEKYRIAVGENATKCPYCGAELGLGGYLYDEYADRPSQRGEAHEAPDGE